MTAGAWQFRMQHRRLSVSFVLSFHTLWDFHLPPRKFQLSRGSTSKTFGITVDFLQRNQKIDKNWLERTIIFHQLELFSDTAPQSVLLYLRSCFPMFGVKNACVTHQRILFWPAFSIWKIYQLLFLSSWFKKIWKMAVQENYRAEKSNSLNFWSQGRKKTECHLHLKYSSTGGLLVWTKHFHFTTRTV